MRFGKCWSAFSLSIFRFRTNGSTRGKSKYIWQLIGPNKMNSDQGFFGNILVKSAIHSLAIQWGSFALAAALKTEKFYDLAGSATFIYLSLRSLSWGRTYFLRQIIQTGFVIIWTLRLGSYLVTRIMKDGSDRRFDEIKQKPASFFVAWTLQGVWVFVSLLPTLIVNSKKIDKMITSRDYIGWSIWLAGFLIETIADWQKSKFKADPDNAGKFINTGLWSISRHPNYFGEILLWSGLFVSATSVLRGKEWISVISPIFIAFLLTKVSGIPMLEESGLKRWGSDPSYQKYVRDTAVLVPYIW